MSPCCGSAVSSGTISAIRRASWRCGSGPAGGSPPRERRARRALRATNPSVRTAATTCQAAVEKLAEYLDSELTPEALGRLEAHLEVCAPCRGGVGTPESGGPNTRKVGESR
ncbi:MAG: hypothetical protein DMD98_01270 [Candidatus Rokuibacteriota bacterium]|nr:MAG: hypothetical protein DMD98_01270 [Candidatus Rokubacteria bacterium]